LLQPPEVQALRDVIAFTSDEEVDESMISGVLIGFDLKSRRFRLAPAEGAIIRGKIADNADIPTVTVPRQYDALIRSTSRVRYSVEEADASYLLLSLYAKED
jgi:hypothetical protein